MAQTMSPLKEVIQPPSDKSFLRLWNKHFLTEIYRNIQTLDNVVEHVDNGAVFGCVAGV